MILALVAAEFYAVKSRSGIPMVVDHKPKGNATVVKGPPFGGIVMLFYGIGHSLLIVAVATSAGAVAKKIAAPPFVQAAAALVACPA